MQMDQFTAQAAPALKQRAQLPWTDAMVVILFNKVYTNMGHLVDDTKRVSATWTTINDEFFMEPELLHYKEKHYRSGDFRKLREKFKSEYGKLLKLKESGNTSHLSGDLSNVMEMVKKMHSEIALEEDDARLKLQAAEKLNDNEDAVLGKGKREQNNAGRRRCLDGSIIGTDSKRPKPAGTASLETLLVDLIKGPAISEAREAVVQRHMMQWVGVKHKNMDIFIEEAEIPELHEHTRVVLHGLSLKVLLNMYCAPGKSFDPSLFKQALITESVPTDDTHRIYFTMQDWMTKAEQYEERKASGKASAEDNDIDSDEEAQRF